MRIDWGAVVLNPVCLRQLEALAQRRFFDTPTADEAVTFVIEQLSDDNWGRLASFSGGARPETFLYSVTVNALEEYARKRFGRVRPPEWLNREGGIWLTVWKMLCLERQPRDYVIDICCAQSKRNPDFIISIIKTVCARIPNCGMQNITVPIDRIDSNHESDYSTMPVTMDLSLQAAVDRAELEERLLLFAELLDNLDRPSNKIGRRDTVVEGVIDLAKLQELRAKLDFSEEEIVVVRMAFQEGLKLKLIAKALNMPEYQPGRILKRLFKEMLSAMQSLGINPPELQSLLMEVQF